MRSRSNVLWFSLLLGIFLSNGIEAQDLTRTDLLPITKEQLWSPSTNSNIQIQFGSKLTLLVLLSPECPMCSSYTPLLKKMNAAYPEDLQVIGIVPGKAYHDTMIVAFAKNYELNFPLFVDKQFMVSGYLKGEVTPEAFLFDRNGQLVYRGAIDNWLSDLGKKRPKADQHYLMDALQQTLTGIAVQLTYAKPKGCLLNEY